MKYTYPSFRVIVGFLMCPLLSGMFLFLTADFYNFFSNGTPTLIHESGLFGFWLYCVLGIFGLLLFGVPAGLLGGIYTHLKLYRKLASYVLVFFLGGGGAHFWAYLLFALPRSDSEISDLFDFSTLNHFLFFALGAFSSLFVAYFVLPKPPVVPPENAK
ncbi:hypothetical protein [Aliidiomarina soli]|uniref:Uncharacterized protein n=1 Tax=Aliidiomarina soli TaxID=1928574 RepID=A0A432WE06_9GAMM|nr:hypothetical protein [Aliidiomarina soli]RUO31127.1 hypothetical protein CWE14_11570 [Aliidiomarina soli]